LAERGYGVCWRILDAQYFGLAQHRERVFIIGSFRNGCAAEVLFECEGLSRGIKKGRKKRATIACTLRSRSTSSGRGGEDDFNLISKTLTSHHGRNSEETYVPALDRTLTNSSTIDHFDESQQTYVWDKNQITSKENRSKLSIKACTLNTSGEMMVGIRRLTPVECEQLQGFPNGWTTNQKDSTRYRQLGNAVAVPVVEWIGKRIVRQNEVNNGNEEN